MYTDAAGYGFISTDDLTAVSRNKKNSISADFISSTKPFFFSVKIPEGNYDVTVTLGATAFHPNDAIGAYVTGLIQPLLQAWAMQYV